ncbi:MAG: DNA polymerase III subunit delta [Candidatus Margulisiibacteriota bacterium]
MADRIYLFFGEEEFLIQEKVEEFKKSIVNPSWNLEQIDGQEPDQERIVSALQTNPLLGGEKLVIIKHADLKLKEWEDLAPSLEAVPSGITVIFWAGAVDKRAKFYKLIDRIGEVCEFKPFAEWEQDQVVSWIVRRARSLGKEIGNPAALSLQEICGNSLFKLASEIDKLITFVGEKRSIGEEDVAALASPGEISNFALSEAVATKDLKKALSAFRILYKNRGDFFQLLSLLATQYRIMLQIKNLAEKNSKKIAQVLGASPYFVRKCMEKTKYFKEEELRGNLELLLDADLRLKSGESLLSTFELLLVSLCGG